MEVRQFRTFTAKQRRSSLLFMLKSNKKPEPPQTRKGTQGFPFQTLPHSAGNGIYKAAQVRLHVLNWREADYCQRDIYRYTKERGAKLALFGYDDR